MGSVYAAEDTRLKRTDDSGRGAGGCEGKIGCPESRMPMSGNSPGYNLLGYDLLGRSVIVKIIDF